MYAVTLLQFWGFPSSSVQEVRDILCEFGFTARTRSQGEEAKVIKRQAEFRARRWVVERAHFWMNRFRRLLIR